MRSRSSRLGSKANCQPSIFSCSPLLEQQCCEIPEKRNKSETKSKMAVLLTCIHYWEGKAGASLSPLACGHSCFNCQTWWPFCGESPCLLSLFFWPLSLPRYLKQASGGIDLEVLMLFTVFTFSLCLLVFMTTSFTWKGINDNGQKKSTWETRDRRQGFSPQNGDQVWQLKQLCPQASGPRKAPD